MVIDERAGTVALEIAAGTGETSRHRSTSTTASVVPCREVFELPVHFQDDNSAVFKFGGTLVNLLKATEAPGLIAPAPVASRDAGARFQFTLGVNDVDAMCEELRRQGVELLNGPIDRPWGLRTASFRDPGGHIWEIAQ
jgi:lactoylglutathione lyase